MGMQTDRKDVADDEKKSIDGFNVARSGLRLWGLRHKG
jgi:hypothetical protein